MKKGQSRFDSVSIEEGSELARFLNGTQGPITAATAYAEWTAGESESAKAARQRMNDRHRCRPHSKTATEAREAMIRRQEHRGPTSG